MSDVRVIHGDCLDVLKTLPDASVDAVVTDPPYGLEFMGKEWDAPWKADGTVLRDPASVGGFQDGTGGNPYSRSRVRFGVGPDFQAWCELWAAECLRVLKPGGHLLAFGGTRTWHRLACAIEDAGFEIRDSIAWLYGSGFPKSLDVSKAIDKAAGAEREVLATIPDRWAGKGDVLQRATQAEAESVNLTAPATDAARTWQGWGTAMKPAFEPVVVARKPLSGTVAQTVLQHGTGALNVDACRIGSREDEPQHRPASASGVGHGKTCYGTRDGQEATYTSGRWPANVVLDEHTAAQLDQQSGQSVSRQQVGPRAGKDAGTLGAFAGQDEAVMGHTDAGGASRFFYVARGDEGDLLPEPGMRCQLGQHNQCQYAESGCPCSCHAAHRNRVPFFYTAKADTNERIRLPKEGAGEGRVIGRTVKQCKTCGSKTIKSGAGGAPACGHGEWENVQIQERVEHVAHPTVKPLALMRWLVRLVTPPGGTVLEPFAGSGTTVEACLLEGFACIAIEREAEYLPLIQQRIDRRRDPVAAVRAQGGDGGLFDLLGDQP